MADKYYSDTQEKIEGLSYCPTVQDTGDLEPATKTITATAEASGIENADYSAALTLPKPGSAKLEVLRIAARLAVTIDSNASSMFHIRVYVDTQDDAHRLFDNYYSTMAQKLVAVDAHSGALSTIFNLLKDGQTHTFYFFLWVADNDAVISEIRLWEGVGTCATSGDNVVLEINHKGLVAVQVCPARSGTGTATLRVSHKGMPGYFYWARYIGTTTTDQPLSLPNIVSAELVIVIRGTVATDANWLYDIFVTMRSEE